MNDIPDLTTYTSEMKKSLLDKAFFVDKIPDAQVFVDYGCGDAVLIRFIKAIFPDLTFVGLDNNPAMLELAKKNCPDVPFFSDFAVLRDFLAAEHKDCKIAVICNSLIHEVYSYSSQKQIDEFWKQVFDPIFSYMVIRDMMLNRYAQRPADPVAAIRVRHKANMEQVRQFEAVWGSINFNTNLIHYLLKYRYTKNWAHEVHENYLPITFEDLMALVPKDRQIEHVEHFTLPFVRTRVKADFGVDLTDNTHLKLIVGRNGG